MILYTTCSLEEVLYGLVCLGRRDRYGRGQRQIEGDFEAMSSSRGVARSSSPPVLSSTFSDPWGRG